MTSSCEIVEALEDAAVELPVDLEGDKEASPAVELLSSDLMATSHYAQVIFNDLAETYSWDLDLVCRYTLTPCIGKLMSAHSVRALQGPVDCQ